MIQIPAPDIPACAAPFSSLYLDARGNVRVCCINSTHPLGNVASESLLDMWNGKTMGELRAAMDAHDYSLGCDLCRPPTGLVIHPTAPARAFDHLGRDGQVVWPRQLELALSNACNLECEMCFGELSSSIRTNREGLAPLPTVYGDRFFEELEHFLPHVEHINFIGGEPFLSREAWRLWNRLDELGIHPSCHVTTNGTIRNRRVDWVLERFPVSFTVSLDGATAATYERIRRGANFDEVMKNLDHFRGVAAGTGSSVSLAFCLSTETWRELPDILLLGDRHDLDVGVNLVSEPARLSLWRSQVETLEEVAAEWSQQQDRLASELVRNRRAWLDNLSWAVSAAAQARTERDGTPVRLGARAATEAARSLAEAHADGGPILHVEIDDADRILSISGAAEFAAGGVGLDPSSLLGRPFIALMSGPVIDRFGSAFTSHIEDRHGRTVRLHEMTFPLDPPVSVQVATAPTARRGSSGRAFVTVREGTRAGTL